MKAGRGKDEEGRDKAMAGEEAEGQERAGERKAEGWRLSSARMPNELPRNPESRKFFRPPAWSHMANETFCTLLV